MVGGDGALLAEGEVVDQHEVGAAVELGIVHRLLQQGEAHLLQLQPHLLLEFPQQGGLQGFAPLHLAARHPPGAPPLAGAHDQHLPLGVGHQGSHGGQGEGIVHRRAVSGGSYDRGRSPSGRRAP